MSLVSVGEPVGVALIGSGRMGAYHGATLAWRLPAARLVAVADPAPGAAENLAAEWGAASAYTDPAQAFADPSVHAVVIAAPARFHADLIVPIDANTRRSFPLTQAPSELFVLKNGSHTGFAGPTALFGTLMDSYDNLGCQAIGNIDVQSFATLGSEAEGISQDPGVCPQPCQTPTGPAALDAQRQQDLTKAIALGFFDGRLRNSAQGTFFVDYRVATDNPELSAQLK